MRKVQLHSLFLLATALLLGSALEARADTPPAAPEAQRPARIVSEEPSPVPLELTTASPGGLTAREAGARASTASFDAAAAEQAVREAAAGVDGAWASYLPRLTASARYMRFSQLDDASTSVVSVVLAPPGTPTGTPNPSPTSAYQVDLSYRPLLDQYLLQATMVVHISDYFLRFNQEYTAASLSRDAAREDVAAARAKATAEGQIAFYDWVRCRHAVVAFVEALNDHRANLRDVRNQRNAGYATEADVLRTETNVAAAEAQVERATRLTGVAAHRVALAIGARDGEALRPGEGLDIVPRPFAGGTPALVAEALASRPEIKSLDANAAAFRQKSRAARAGALPSINAIGNLLYADPQPRRIQPIPEWSAGWDVGVGVVWTPNGLLTARAEVESDEARAAKLDALRGQLSRMIELEVTEAYSDWKGLETTIALAERQVASAAAARRTARDLFLNNTSPSSVLTDAELELSRARLGLLNAQADRLIAGVRLAHAVGHTRD